MKTIIKFLVILSFFQVYSQGKEPDPYGGQIYSPIDVTANRYLDKEDEFTGTTYLFSEWENDGKFYINGKSYKVNNVNINALENDLESKVGKDSILVYDKYKIDSVKINNRKFKKYNDNSFYEVIYAGDSKSLLKKYKVDVVKGTYNVAQGKYDKTKLKVSDTYYIKEGENISSFNLSKKSIIEFCEGNEANIKKYIKTNKLSIKKDEDIAKILKYNASL